MLASCRTCTGVVGARIVVFAEAEVVAAYQLALVDVPVAVVVDAVAFLGSGLALLAASFPIFALRLCLVESLRFRQVFCAICLSHIKENIGSNRRLGSNVGEGDNFDGDDFDMRVPAGLPEVLRDLQRFGAAAGDGQEGQAYDAALSAPHRHSPLADNNSLFLRVD